MAVFRSCWNRFRMCKPSLIHFSHRRVCDHRFLGSLSLYSVSCADNITFRCKNLHNHSNVLLSANILGDILRNSFTTTTSLSKKKKGKKETVNPSQEEGVDELGNELLDDPDFDALRSEMDILGFLASQASQSFDLGIMVLQPWVKWGPNMKHDTTAQLMLDEAVALMSTLPGVRVVHKETVAVRNTDSKTVFGSGTLERLVSLSRSSKGVTTVFISVDMLKNVQVEALEEEFKMRVLDRYSVVLGIFRHHARTREAKLQIALAELPYVKKRLGVQREKERMMMMEREKRLRNALNAIAGNRALVRHNRRKSDIPTVAVVGYTNAGKTSLIRAITGDVRAEGKDQLFATLDVTAHGGRLPCGLEILFIDTVGFIQEIPTDLIASFKATLEDAVFADVIVHIRDASHPDYKLQGITVENTLSTLPFPKETPIITVANKIDLGNATADVDAEKTHLISASTGQGLDDLLYDIEAKVLKVTGRQFWRFKLPTGSDEIRWLRQATGLVHEEMDPDNPQVTQVVAVMTDQELAAYKRNFKKRK